MMDLDHWYRCTVCGYRYTPQQVQALVQLLAPAPEEAPERQPGPVPCRKRGCPGTLTPTDELHGDTRR